jgi:MerR family transcriptional regulator, heat shock protein HspR
MDFEIDKEIDKDAPLYSIGVIADLLQISVHTLRLYESEGLIIPFKKGSKHRLYSYNDLVRLKCIRDSITNKKFSIPSIKTIYSLIPCWAIKKCPVKDRQNCDAYKGMMQPCWTYKHNNNICESGECRLCDVYKLHNQCETIKESIKNNTRF